MRPQNPKRPLVRLSNAIEQRWFFSLSRLTLPSLPAHLEQTLKSEQTLPEFSDLPRDYLEVSKVLLEVSVLVSSLSQHAR